MCKEQKVNYLKKIKIQHNTNTTMRALEKRFTEM